MEYSPPCFPLPDDRVLGAHGHVDGGMETKPFPESGPGKLAKEGSWPLEEQSSTRIDYILEHG